MPLARWVRQPAKAIVLLVDRLAFPPARGTDDQWLRIVMNEHVAQRLGRLPRSRLDALEVSGDNYRDEGWRSYRSIHWPQHDICDPDLDIEPADVIVADQVLEHVPRPWLAIQNMRRLCRDGGLVVVTTPFLVRRHELPSDYWRFTEEGMRVLLEDAGLRVEAIRTWGNRLCVVGNLGRWSRPRSWYPMGNERDFPAVLWAFATPQLVRASEHTGCLNRPAER